MNKFIRISSTGFFVLFFLFNCLITELFSQIPYPSNNKIRTLYNSLDPKSISQHLAFYELYQNDFYGQQALQDAWKLMSNFSLSPKENALSVAFSKDMFNSLVSLVNKPIDQSPPLLSSVELQMIERISSQLPHTKLKGHNCISETEVSRLFPEEVDVARGVFLGQFGSDLLKTRSYEAIIDLMALQIKAKLPSNASPEIKIKEINSFIFDEMGFRFPPHSLYAKDIDVYTFLPSVLDSHRGVCLGVSILYLCLAQRLELSLEAVTPPGHIYVRYRNNNKVINIETTARGVHIESDEYLSLKNRSLQQRNIKEVIGLAHFNQASVYLQKELYQEALNSYLKAEQFLPDDPFLKELMAYCYLFLGDTGKGIALLKHIADIIPEDAIIKNTTPEDYLNDLINEEGIKVVYKHVDEDRASVLTKKALLEETVKKFPHFRAGVFQLAVAWLQLHRLKEALEILEYYHHIFPDDPEANYYLTVLYIHRLDYNQAWKHLKITEEILEKRNYRPKPLKELREELSEICPEYIVD